jgi:hypothetical protein
MRGLRLQPVHATPPGSTLPVDRTNNTTDDPAPWLHLHRARQRLPRYYEPVRRRVPRRYSLPYGSAAWQAPPRHPPRCERQCRNTPSHVSCRSSRPDSPRLHAAHHLASQRSPARLIPGVPTAARFRCHLVELRHVNSDPRKTRTAHRLSGPHPTHPVGLFHIAHHDGLQPTQHVVV